jgi:hypothetical protein
MRASEFILESILLEGGNVFKNADGTPATGRVNKADVPATVKFVEQITGLDFTSIIDPKTKYPARWLGSTGKAPSSGDLDLAVDVSEISKEALAAKITQWVQAQGQNINPKEWVVAKGEVHFKTPIAGDPKKGYVQTDFMFFPDVDWGVFYYGGGMNSAYKGVYRNILMSSIAKQLGLKIGSNGVISRTSNQVVTKDPDHTAELILGPGHTHANLENVESIYKALANDPDRDAKLNDFREYLAKDGLTEPGAAK